MMVMMLIFNIIIMSYESRERSKTDPGEDPLES